MVKEYELRVKADTNDGDYVHEISVITQEELDLLRPMFEQIKNFKPYTVPHDGTYIKSWTHSNNFPTGDCHRNDLGEKSPREIYGWTEEQYECIHEYMPCSEYGIHTIESVTVCEKPNLEVLI